MAWDEAHRRMDRESRARRAETYEAVRDAYIAGEISIGRAKPRGGYRTPAYLEPESGRASSGRDLARLVAAHGGHVERPGPDFVPFREREMLN